MYHGSQGLWLDPKGPADTAQGCEADYFPILDIFMMICLQLNLHTEYYYLRRPGSVLECYKFMHLTGTITAGYHWTLLLGGTALHLIQPTSKVDMSSGGFLDNFFHPNYKTVFFFEVQLLQVDTLFC